jgi:hypothetical protein
MSRPIDRVLTAIGDYTGRGPRYRAKCPVHQGTSANSLSLCEADNGIVLITCFGGCDRAAIIQALGLAWGDLFPEDYQPRQSPRPPREPGRAHPARALLQHAQRALVRDHVLSLLIGPVPSALDLHYFGPRYVPIIEALWDAFAVGGHRGARDWWAAQLPRLRWRAPQVVAAVMAECPRFGIRAVPAQEVTVWRH